MNRLQRQIINQPSKYKQIVWDYNLSSNRFFEILDGKKEEGWLNRKWATARILSGLNYYDAIGLIDMDYLRDNWGDIKPKIINKSIRKGYDFVLQKSALSSSR